MLKLDNPKQARTLAEIIAGMPDGAKVEAAKRLARVNRLLTRRTRADADLIDSLRWILESPNPQAERLRELLKEICKCWPGNPGTLTERLGRRVRFTPKSGHQDCPAGSRESLF